MMSNNKNENNANSNNNSIREEPWSISSYSPPEWAADAFENVPKYGRLTLANLPTPVHKVVSYTHDDDDDDDDDDDENSNVQLPKNLYMKRDDMTGGIELSGNKIRKLEFLLAEALQKNYDAVVTIGGEQSNHCRATAAVCRMVGLEPHLILRTNNRRKKEDTDFGITGNILIDRMVGSHIYTCTKMEYGRIGSNKLLEHACQKIQQSSKKEPYVIPVGGSNALGTWGYIDAIDELTKQSGNQKVFDHIVFACGSGGTATGITLGTILAHEYYNKNNTSNTQPPKLHAIGVCDDADYFYSHMASIAQDMGFRCPDTTIEEFFRKHVTVHQGKGNGYAISTTEELQFIINLSKQTGIVLDPVYSGKALYHFLKEVKTKKEEDERILFWHTGGALGMYEKGKDLVPLVQKVSTVESLLDE